MSLWIPVTLIAAVFQTVRFMLQKSLSTVKLSAAGATFARFFYSAPLIVAGLAGYVALSGHAFPELSFRFWAFAAVGGLTQILATVCVVMLFKQRNFAVGITFAKTEVIQTVLLGYVILGEGVSGAGFGAILLGLVAVLLLSKTPGNSDLWWQNLTNRASLLGLGSGILFAFASVGYRGATLQIDDAEPAFRAAVTLAMVTTLQMASMALWLAWRDRAELSAVWSARHSAVFIGLTSMAGSFGWFFAFSLQNAAYVKALGQVELVLSLLASALFFREKITRRELAGMAVLGLSIILLVAVI